MTNIVTRSYSRKIAEHLVSDGIHPVMARIYAARGIHRTAQMQTSLALLIRPDQLKNADHMAKLLADAIEQNKRLLIVADYDSDGATACAVAIKALREYGASVDFMVPNRFEHGYGLTPEIVQLALPLKPDIIVTVDNGIASVEGVNTANQLGISVLVTDHHLPADALPDAACIVNPNAPGCTFPSKNLAGVGVIFYVMLALRNELRQRQRFADGQGPNLADLLDIVALGTVADVVRLDDNNRILVDQGLRRIRSGKACPGIRALLNVAGRNPARATSHDLGFVLGPRLNAAGRLEDMSLGIACLLAENDQAALPLARRLDEINRHRREIESDMHKAAWAVLDTVSVKNTYSLSLYDREWHQGVIGILASRLKEKLHRPTIVFAAAGDGSIKGSGRSIASLHLRDALDLITKRQPELILKFGGHAMAAGLVINEADFSRFSECFEQVASELLEPGDLEQIIETDGTLTAQEHSMQLAHAMDHGIWGQGFPMPLFEGEFNLLGQRVVGERHLKLELEKEGQTFDAMLFFQEDQLPSKIRATYQIGVNEFRGEQKLQLILRYWTDIFPSVE